MAPSQQCASVEVARDVVSISGDDAVVYLHSQLSQDIVGLDTGESAWSFLLTPNGKVVGWFRVTRVAATGFLIDTEPGAARPIVERLEKFRLRMHVTLHVERRLLRRYWGDEHDGNRADNATEGTLVLTRDWPQHAGIDELGAIIGEGDAIGPDDIAGCEWRRISAGVPAAGVDFATDGSFIPAELGPWAMQVGADFDKGCYTGQELVLRMANRGNNAPRPLRMLLLQAGPVPPAGTALTYDGAEVGRITSTAQTPSGATVGLGVVARKVTMPGEATAHVDGIDHPVRVEELPTG